MFESQMCSLVTITFMVQIFGLITVIGYRVRGNGRFNQLGLFLGILTMGLASIICMSVDARAGLSQGVALVFVAVTATLCPLSDGN